MNIKKIFQVLLLPVLSLQFFAAQSAHVSYAHGFGEKNRAKSAAFYYEKFGGQDGGYSVVVFPDEAGDIGSAVFYTQPAVEAVINNWHEQVCIEKNDSLIVVGYSCGGGTVINGLAKLIEYAACDGSEGCFDGTFIQSVAQAQDIINAINNGAIVLNAPLLDIKKTYKIIDMSAYLQMGTMIAATTVAAYIGSTNIFFAGGVGFAAHTILGSYMQKIYAVAIARFYLPMRTNGRFNPTYPTPRESLLSLNFKFMCPVLLHVNKNDGVIADFDADTLNVFQTITLNQVHTIITTDGHHDKSSKQFVKALEMFNNHYF